MIPYKGARFDFSIVNYLEVGPHNNIAGLLILSLDVLGKFSQKNYIDVKTEITTTAID